MPFTVPVVSQVSPAPDRGKDASDGSSVARTLRESIERGEYGVNQKLPAERKLAERFEVGRWVVRKAIHELAGQGILRLSPNCRPIVERIGAKVSFGRPQANQIAIWLCPSMEDFGAARMFEGVRGVLAAHGLQMVVGCPPSRDPADVRQALIRFIKGAIDNPNIGGTILWALEDPELVSGYQSLTSAGIPLVFIDREPPSTIEADVVSTHHRRAACAAVRHLIELGHRRIAVVSNDDRASSVRERILGYHDAMDELGADAASGPALQVATYPASRLKCETDSVVQQLFDSQKPPTAIFAVNDSVAIYLQESIERTGRSVPEDVSLVGFDWMLRWLPNGGDLTSIAQPFDEIGRVAARCLIERIESSDPPTYRHILLNAPLIVRRSSGEPKP